MTRLFSLAVAVLMVLSLAAVSVSAASTAHAVTLTPSATTGKAGDAVSVSIAIDQTQNISGLNYRLKFDPNVFSIDTVNWGTGGKAYPKYFDQTFMNNIRAGVAYTGGILMYGYLGMPTYSADTVNGTISFALSASDGVDPADNEAGALIGKFNLIVKAGAAAGATSITLIDAVSIDGGQSNTAAMNITPVTFTVEGAAPITHTVTYDGNGATGGSAPTQAPVAEGVKFNAATNTFTRDGYTFEGWSTAVDTTVEYAAGAEITMGTENVILYAVWKEVVVNNEIVATINGDGIVLLGTTPVISGNTYSYTKDEEVKVTAYPKMGFVISSAKYDGKDISIDADGGYYNVTVSGSKALVITFSERSTISEKASIPQTCKKFFTQTVNHNGKDLKAATAFATKPTPAGKTIISYGVKLTDDTNNEIALFDAAGNSVSGHFKSTTDTKGLYNQYGIEFAGLTAGKTYIATSYVQYSDGYVYGIPVSFVAE